MLRKAQRRLWMKYALRGVGGNDNHARLELAYRMPDPWNMESPMERARFEATNRVIEQAFGRVRSVRNAPRTLDLDLLLYGDRVLHDDTLTLPHPRLHLRAFVLQPLAEIDPRLVLPGHGGLAPWLARAADQGIERIGAA